MDDSSSTLTLFPVPAWLTRWLAALEVRERLTPYLPLLASADVRQSGSRVCVVDPNRFPQGFNNVWKAGDFPRGAEFAAGYILKRNLKHNTKG